MPMNFSLCVGAASSLAIVAALHAQPFSQVIAKTGDPFPGLTPGAVFRGGTISSSRVPGISLPVLAQSGEVTFSGLQIESGRVVESAIVRFEGSTLRSIPTRGIVVPPETAPNGVSVVPFTEGALAGIAQSALGGFGIVAGEPFRFAVRTGDPVANQPGGTNWSLNNQVIAFPWQSLVSANRQGDVVFQDFSGTRLGFASAAGGGTPVILEAGQTIDGVRVSSVFRPVVTGDGSVFALANTSNAAVFGPALFGGHPTNLRPLVYGTFTPGLPAGSRTIGTTQPSSSFAFPSAAYAADGRVASVLNATVGGAGPTSAVLFAGTSAGVSAVFWGGKETAGLPTGWRSDSLFSFNQWRPMAATDDVVGASFPFAVDATSPMNQFGVVVGRAGAIRLVMKTGDQIADHNSTVESAVLLGLNRWEDVLISTGIIDADAVRRTTLLVSTRDQGLLTLLTSGEAFEIAPGDLRTVQSFETDRLGVISAINDQRQAVASVLFTDGTDAVVRFTIPTPSAALPMACAAIACTRRRRAGSRSRRVEKPKQARK